MEYKKIVSPTLKELFIEEIERQILSGELKAGEKLPPEREIALNMNISRSVVNSGIVEMSKKGFLEIIPRKGTYVTDYRKHATPEMLVSIMKHGALSEDYIRSTLEVRELFMCRALEEAVPVITDEQIEKFRAAAQNFSSADSVYAGAEQLYLMDCLITEFSGNLLLPILISSFKMPNIMLFERYLRIYGFDDMRKRNKLLLEYMEGRDTEAAVELMRNSVRESLGGSRQIYAE